MVYKREKIENVSSYGSELEEELTKILYVNYNLE